MKYIQIIQENLNELDEEIWSHGPMNYIEMANTVIKDLLTNLSQNVFYFATKPFTRSCPKAYL